jgi:hypothetical protein
MRANLHSIADFYVHYEYEFIFEKMNFRRTKRSIPFMQRYSVVSYPTPLPTVRLASSDDGLDDIARVLRSCNHALETYHAAVLQQNENAMKWAMLRYHGALR